MVTLHGNILSFNPFFDEVTAAAAAIELNFDVVGQKLVGIDGRLRPDKERYGNKWDTVHDTYSELLRKSRNAASEIAVTCDEFEITMFLIVYGASDSSGESCEDVIEMLEESQEGARNLHTRATELANGFDQMRVDIGKFGAENRDRKTIPKAATIEHIEAINNSIKSMRVTSERMTALVCADVALTSALAVTTCICPPCGALLLFKTAVLGVEGCLLVSSSPEARIQAKHEELRDLERQLKADILLQLDTCDELSELADGPLTEMKESLKIFENIWRGIVAHSTEISKWLEKGARRVDKPDILKNNLQQSNTIYTTMSVILNSML